MKQALSIARKELRSYFSSPIAFIFIGVFLFTTIISFFWVDTFFVRGIADVRPLFHWAPVLMILLTSALTMRQWSEEQRSGTMEILLTLPVSTVYLVIGKFLAVLALVAFALALTLFLPITVEVLGNLDWGPVIGGYLATLLLAAAYAAIGLFVSSLTDNQIVALISTITLCAIFQLVGSSAMTDFTGNTLGNVLRAIGAGSRFDSIQRGVIDLRDLLYYLALTGVFLTLNVLALKTKRWSTLTASWFVKQSISITAILVILNLIVANVWAYPLRGLRVDMTQYHEYTLSRTTRELLGGLQEPLIIRGYFSEKTHPKLAPLAPIVQDMLMEYENAGGGRVQVDIIDPAADPDKEAEAAQIYGIQPTPFQVSGRYEASIINSYFDILIQYGDQSTTLSFQDLINVENNSDGTFDVVLQNLEYDLTRTIKKVVYGFQNLDTVLASFNEPVALTVYLTPNTLPAELAEAPATIEKVVQEIADRANGKFTYSIVDPTAADSPITPQQLYDTYKIQPYAVSLFSNDVYYLHMLLQVGDKGQAIYPSGTLSESDVRTAIESALKRSATGFLQVVGLWTPPSTPTTDMYGQTQEPLSSWNYVREALGQEYEVRTVDLSTGNVDADVSILILVGPENLDDKMRYTVDQYLMRGGVVMVAAGNYALTLDQYTGSLAVRQLAESLQPMLEHYGVTVEPSLILDPQNEPFPMPVMRQVGAFQVQEYQALNYPFFLDIQSDGMAENHPVLANLPAMTVNWASPVVVDAAKNAARTVTPLLHSSDQAWTVTDGNIQPDTTQYPEYGFPIGATQQTYTVAVAIQGVFESYFKGKASPFEATEGPTTPDATPTPEAAATTATGVIESSPETARLIVVGSLEFLDDIVFEISTTLSGDRYLNTLKMMQNTVAWATEDLDLLNIRTRGASARLLTVKEGQESFWVYLNLALALISLVVIGVVSHMSRHNEEPLELIPTENLKE
ncbi:MAG: Gldg family protein [Phycisphaerae bacterium]|nr:Gldg family protein [Phycisphaerae bacterium]